MRVLSLIQPWASLIAEGHKRNETRSWQVKWRGTIAIHASKAIIKPKDFEQMDPEFLLAFMRVMAPARYEYFRGFAARNPNRRIFPFAYEILETLPHGQIICTARLADVASTDRLLVMDSERLFGDYSPGRFAWILQDVRKLRQTIPFRGAQGLRDLPADVRARVELDMAEPYAA